MLICCADNDGARWLAGVLAALYLKPLLDLGTGVLPAAEGQGTPDAGADIRFLVPGDRCLQCLGGIAHEEHLRETLRSRAREQAFQQERRWPTERAGSLRSVNQIAVGLSLRLFEEFLQGLRTESVWLRWSSNANGSCQRIQANTGPGCRVCRWQGSGDSGLTAVSSLSDVGLSQTTPFMPIK